MLNLNPNSSILTTNLAKFISKILLIDSLSNELKTITSSTLFKNSGEKKRFKAFSITIFESFEAFASLLGVPNPTPAPKSLICRLPMFDVIINIVFLKSIFLPKLSVKKPSSKTCNNILNTSGCAFSTSSSKTTA